MYDAGVPEPMHGPSSPQIVPDHLILSQPGGQVMPTTLLLDPRIFRTSFGPVIYVVFYDRNRRQQDKNTLWHYLKYQKKFKNSQFGAS